MLPLLHRWAGLVALATVMAFLWSTLVAEVWLSASAVAEVKGAIVAGLFLLVPALALTGITGARLARGRPAAAPKQRRMKILAANGLLIMIPAALFLNAKATAGEVDGAFYLVQALELAVGILQAILMGRNILDGRRLAREGGLP